MKESGKLSLGTKRLAWSWIVGQKKCNRNFLLSCFIENLSSFKWRNFQKMFCSTSCEWKETLISLINVYLNFLNKFFMGINHSFLHGHLIFLCSFSSYQFQYIEHFSYLVVSWMMYLQLHRWLSILGSQQQELV